MWLCTAELANLMFMVLSNATGSLQQAKLVEFKVCSYICDIIAVTIKYCGHNIYFHFYFSYCVCEILDFDFVLFCLVFKFYLSFFIMLQKNLYYLICNRCQMCKLKKNIWKLYILQSRFFLKWFLNKIFHTGGLFSFDPEWDWVDLWAWSFLKL